MSAGEADLICDQGATFSVVITYKNSSGSAINLSGYGARMDIRYGQTTDADILLALGASNGFISVSDATNGKITINIPASTTDNFNPQTYYYDLEIFNTNVSPTFVDRVIMGKFDVTPQVTSSAS